MSSANWCWAKCFVSKTLCLKLRDNAWLTVLVFSFHFYFLFLIKTCSFCLGPPFAAFWTGRHLGASVSHIGCDAGVGSKMRLFQCVHCRRPVNIWPLQIDLRCFSTSVPAFVRQDGIEYILCDHRWAPGCRIAYRNHAWPALGSVRTAQGDRWQISRSWTRNRFFFYMRMIGSAYQFIVAPLNFFGFLQVLRARLGAITQVFFLPLLLLLLLRLSCFFNQPLSVQGGDFWPLKHLRLEEHKQSQGTNKPLSWLTN